MDAQKGIVWVDREGDHRRLRLDNVLASPVLECLKHQKLVWGSSIKRDNTKLIDDKLLSTGYEKSLREALIINSGKDQIRLSEPNHR